MKPLYDFSSLAVDRTVAPRDGMVSPDLPEQYFDLGRRALELIQFSAELCDKPHYPNILDLPCGHGRHSIEFARRGLRVVGVDLNEEPLEKAYWAAREAGVKVDLRRVDMREIEFREEFDAVFNLWTSFGYFENETEDQLVLDRAYRALRPGGAFVLETVNLYAVLRRFEPRSWHELGDGRMLLEERSFDPFTARMTSGWTLIEPTGERVEMAFVTRAYTLVELVRMLTSVGFEVERAFGDYQGSDYAIDSRRMIVIARRRGR